MRAVYQGMALIEAPSNTLGFATGLVDEPAPHRPVIQRTMEMMVIIIGILACVLLLWH